MNKEQLQGQWNVIKGEIKQQWGKLTDDDLTEISGKRDQLLGKLQQRYGYAKEKAEEELSRFERTHTQRNPGQQPNQPHGINNPNQQNKSQQENRPMQDKGGGQQKKEKARF